MKNTTMHERKQFMTGLAEALKDVGAELVESPGETPWVDIPLEFRTWLSVMETDAEAAAYAFDADGAPFGVTGMILTADETGATDNGYVLFVARPAYAEGIIRAALEVYEKQAQAEQESLEAAMAVLSGEEV